MADFSVIGDSVGTEQSSGSRVTDKVMHVLCEKTSREIKMPAAPVDIFIFSSNVTKY